MKRLKVYVVLTVALVLFTWALPAAAEIKFDDLGRPIPGGYDDVTWANWIMEVDQKAIVHIYPKSGYNNRMFVGDITFKHVWGDEIVVEERTAGSAPVDRFWGKADGGYWPDTDPMLTVNGIIFQKWIKGEANESSKRQ